LPPLLLLLLPLLLVPPLLLVVPPLLPPPLDPALELEPDELDDDGPSSPGESKPPPLLVPHAATESA
jgi:hypothetical protein